MPTLIVTTINALFTLLIALALQARLPPALDRSNVIHNLAA